jgi:hypothetical protein
VWGINLEKEVLSRNSMDEAGLPPDCGSYRLAAGTFGARPKLARQWGEGKEHMVYPGNPGLGLGRWENEW